MAKISKETKPWASKGHILRKATLSRPRDISDLPNKQKPTQRVSKNEDEKLVPNETKLQRKNEMK